MTGFLSGPWRSSQFGDSSEDAADVECNNPKCCNDRSWGEQTIHSTAAQSCSLFYSNIHLTDTDPNGLDPSTFHLNQQQTAHKLLEQCEAPLSTRLCRVLDICEITSLLSTEVHMCLQLQANFSQLEHASHIVLMKLCIVQVDNIDTNLISFR